ncbi:MAG: queuosine salvage family protein [Ardenticatenales bacterium]
MLVPTLPTLPAQVRASCARIAATARRATPDAYAIPRLAARIAVGMESGAYPAAGWDTSIHFVGSPEATVQYLLVLDALNFCFWPTPGFEYDTLATRLRDVLTADAHAFDVDRLAALTPDELAGWLGAAVWPLDERARLVREVGAVLAAQFDGSAARLVEAAGGSAAGVASLVAAELPGFRDHAVYDGRQVFFYKRAQIFAGDVWGALGGQGLGRMDDIDELTTFADYRVPQLLRAQGAIALAPDLAARIDAGEELAAGGVEEVEIRAATVVVVEAVRDALASLGRPISAVELDWRLWQRAEAIRDKLPAHHRVRTVAY